MRIISVVMGAGSFSGRENASAALLNYAFTFYETRLAVKGATALASAHVWKAAFTPADLGIKSDLWLTVPRGQSDLKVVTDVQPKLIAPLSTDANVGTVKVMLGNETLATQPLHPLKPVGPGSWWRRLIDTIRLWFA
jgi:D-alanyl-D-alanine carboxypeptidase (penicillin-binding protein 5/6)